MIHSKSSIKQFFLTVWMISFYWSRFPKSYSISLPSLLSSSLKYGFPFIVLCIWFSSFFTSQLLTLKPITFRTSPLILFVSSSYLLEALLSLASGSTLNSFVPYDFRSQLLGDISSLTGMESFTIPINNFFYFCIFPPTVLQVFGRRVVSKSVATLLIVNSYYGILQFLSFFNSFFFKLMPVTLGQFDAGPFSFLNHLRAVGFTSNNGSFFYSSTLLLGSLFLLSDKKISKIHLRITFVSIFASTLSLSRSFLPLSLAVLALFLSRCKVSLKSTKLIVSIIFILACLSCLLVSNLTEFLDLYQDLIDVRLNGDISASVRIQQLTLSLQNIFSYPFGQTLNTALSFDTTFAMVIYRNGFIAIGLVIPLAWLTMSCFNKYYGRIIGVSIVLSFVACYLLVGSPFSFLSQFLYGLLCYTIYEEYKNGSSSHFPH